MTGNVGARTGNICTEPMVEAAAVRPCRAVAGVPVEFVFTSGMLLLMVGLSLAFNLPILTPSFDCASFVGLHYLCPLLLLAVCGVCAAIGQRDAGRAWMMLSGLPCFSLVMWAHFNIKLWTPLINPRSYDDAFWSVDSYASGLVAGCIWLRHRLEWLAPYSLHPYLYGFIAMFYISFVYHAWRTPDVFRKVFLAALFFQGLGAIAYLVMPAVGPFIYQDGVSAITTQTQRYMLGVHIHLLREGSAWLATSGAGTLLAGLGAMPSLHAGGAFLFLRLAARYGRALLPLYIPLFLFIVLSAIASRWHYLVDLPAGMALACLAIALAEKAERRPAAMPEAVPSLPLEPAFG